MSYSFGREKEPLSCRLPARQCKHRQPAGTPSEDSRVAAEVSASSFSTRNLMRDRQVRSSLFLHARRHPAISFRSDSTRTAPGRLVGYRGPHGKGTCGAR